MQYKCFFSIEDQTYARRNTISVIKEKTVETGIANVVNI